MQSRSAKKRRNAQEAETTSTRDAVAPVESAARADLPKIQPGERLGDFAARVNQAFTVGGLTRKGKVKVEGLKERQTKTEKRLQKMYASWREEEARRKEKSEEEQELEEEAEDEREAAMGGQSLKLPNETKTKRKRMVGENIAADNDDDPWAELNMNRAQPRGLHDVVKAPPTFKAVPREKFKVRNGARVDVSDVPGAAGSLKRREELGRARREVIERYRGMMGKGGDGGGT